MGFLRHNKQPTTRPDEWVIGEFIRKLQVDDAGDYHINYRMPPGGIFPPIKRGKHEKQTMANTVGVQLPYTSSKDQGDGTIERRQ